MNKKKKTVSANYLDYVPSIKEGTKFSINEKKEVTIFATNTLGISYTASLDKETFEVSGADQTFVLTINASEKITWDGIGYKVFYDFPLVLTDISNSEVNLKAADKTTNLGSGENGAAI